MIYEVLQSKSDGKTIHSLTDGKTMYRIEFDEIKFNELNRLGNGVVLNVDEMNYDPSNPKKTYREAALKSVKVTTTPATTDIEFYLGQKSYNDMAEAITKIVPPEPPFFMAATEYQNHQAKNMVAMLEKSMGAENRKRDKNRLDSLMKIEAEHNNRYQTASTESDSLRAFKELKATREEIRRIKERNNIK